MGKYICLFITITFLAQGTSIAQKSKQQRLIRTDELTLLKTIDLEEHGIIFPSMLEVDAEGNIYVVDYHKPGLNRLSILRATDEYSALHVVVDRNGRGPREIMGISGSDIADDGNIWMVDSDKFEVSIWSKDGFIRENKVTLPMLNPRTITVCPDTKKHGLFILSSQANNDGNIYHFSHDFKLLNIFGQKYESFEKSNVFITDGDLACDENGNVHYTRWLLTKMESFAPSGELINQSEIFNFIPNDPVIQVLDGGKEIQPARGYRVVARQTKVYEDKLHVGIVNQPQSYYRHIDVYRVSDLGYLYSYRFDPAHFVTDHFARNGKLYIIDRGEEANPMLYIYKLHD